MRWPAFWRRGACWLFLAFAAAGCKSEGAADIFDLGPAASNPPSATPASPPPSTETKIGSGPVHIAVLLPLAATGPAAEHARDVRDGVTLAVDDLGSDVLTVALEDSSAAGSRKAAMQAMTDGAAAIIGPFEAGSAAEVATIKGGTLSPIFLLADGVPGGASIYNVALQSGASAAAGTRALGKEGARNFVLLSPEGSSAAATEKAVDFAAADHGGRLVAKARFSENGLSVQKAVDTVFSVSSAPDAVVIAGGAFDPAMVVAAVRVKSGNVKIVGNNSWKASNLASPALDGILIADLDEAEMGAIASRFRARFGHDLTPLAAYAYDVIALSSGIARAIGRDGFVRTIVEDAKGFRGATGIFRFRGNGNCDRLLALYRIQKGKFKKIQSPPAIF